MFVRSPPVFRRFISIIHLCCVTLACGVLAAAPAHAQDEGSHWGARASFTPTWEMTDSLRDALFDEGEDGNWKGSEFSIGFVRGSTYGGDWGVSFVRKPFDDESFILETSEECFTGGGNVLCRPNTERRQFDGVYLNAFEVHGYFPFVTIARRVQVGLNVAGGVGTMNGNVITIRDRFEPTFGPGGPTGLRPIHEEEVLAAKDEILPVFPLFKLEAEGAVIVAPALKIKISGGLNFPAYSFRIGAVYLFGA